MEQQQVTILVAIVGGICTLVVGLFGPYISGWFARKLQGRQLDHDTTAPTPPTTQQVWERLDKVETAARAAEKRAGELEDVVGAAVGALAEVADQWTGPHPKISARFLAVLEQHGHLPEQWKDIE